MYWMDKYPYFSVLLYAMSFDILTGVLRAIDDKALNSDICGKGMRKKAAMIILVLAAHAFKPIVGDIPAGEWLAVSFAFAEGISIIENVILLGAPVPQGFKDYFLDLKQASDNMFRVGDSPRQYDKIIEKRKETDPIEDVLKEIEQ